MLWKLNLILKDHFDNWISKEKTGKSLHVNIRIQANIRFQFVAIIDTLDIQLLFQNGMLLDIRNS